MNELLYFKRMALKAEISEIDLKQNHLWAQRSRSKWIKEREKNTTFFYKICYVNQRKRLITEVEDHFGVKQTTNVAIVDSFIHHFQYLYKKVSIPLVWIQNLEWNAKPFVPSSTRKK